MIKIYHNPRCRKSREGLALLEASGQKFEIVRYLDNPPDPEELQGLLTALDISPIQLVRKNEAIWKSDYKGKDLSDNELIEALSQHPKLIERPIVIKHNKAVIARPAERINELL